MKAVKVTVEKTLVLQFTLPGYRGGGTSRLGTGNGIRELPCQLERVHGPEEYWRIEINSSNAHETLDTFRKLAAEIALAIELGI